MKTSVIALIFSEDKKSVVSIKRCDVPIWVFPGGGVDPGETPEEAVVREVLEETGLTVEIVKLVSEYYPTNRLTNLTFMYQCSVKGGILAKGDETRDIGYFPINHLPYPFLHVHKYWLEDARSESPVTLKKAIKGASYAHFILFIFLHPLLMFRYILSMTKFTINTKKP